jgi:hypothetical protein
MKGDSALAKGHITLAEYLRSQTAHGTSNKRSAADATQRYHESQVAERKARNAILEREHERRHRGERLAYQTAAVLDHQVRSPAALHAALHAVLHAVLADAQPAALHVARWAERALMVAPSAAVKPPAAECPPACVHLLPCVRPARPRSCVVRSWPSALRWRRRVRRASRARSGSRARHAVVRR